MAALYPLDMWNIFVTYVFGGFWPAVIGLMLIFFIIMLFGKVSMYSVLNIMVLFLLAMVLGYGSVLMILPITIFIIARFVYDLIGMISRMRA